MRWVRFEHALITSYGWLEMEHVVPVSGTPWAPGAQLAPLPLAEVRLLAPVQPGKIVCVGINYDGHIREVGRERPPEPVIFLKPPSSVIGPGEAIRWPKQVESLFFEGELAVVIARRASKVSPEEASSVILGYTCANDVSARDLQKRDTQWTRGKGFDTFCPVGPCIETSVFPTELPIRTVVDGELRQDGNTRDLIYDANELVSFISHVMTLEPGDLVLTGTPAGAGPLEPGQEVRVTVEGIGTLANPVHSERT